MTMEELKKEMGEILKRLFPGKDIALWKRIFPNETYLAIGVSKFSDDLFITGDNNMRNYDNLNKWVGRNTLGLPIQFNRHTDMRVVKEFVCEVFEAKENEVVDRTRPELRVYEKNHWYDKNSKVVIFIHINRIVIEVYQPSLMFTLVDNYDFEKNWVKDINLAEELPQLKNYEEAKAYIIERYGFSEENICGGRGKDSKEYSYKRFS